MSFAEQLAVGRVAEGLIAKWLQARGSAVMPAYEIEKSSGKGPQLFSLDGDFVAPDLLAFTHNGVCWIEAKHKSVFTWYRYGRCWETGIDQRHYDDYKKVAERTKTPVWLLFFHRESEPSQEDRAYRCPPECPVGLYGGNLSDLALTESHRSPALDHGRVGMKGHGRSGMVYWSEESLSKLATKAEVICAADQTDSFKRAPKYELPEWVCAG